MNIRTLSFPIHWLLAVLVAFSAVSCSSTNWVVVDEKAADINDYKLESTRYYLQSNNNVSPSQPLISFDLKAINTFEYAQKVKTERYIQRYRPRLGYVLLGLAGAGLSTYAAFSDNLITQPTKPQRYSLLGAGTLLTSLSLMNMKPLGEPTKTGESRLLRRTGSLTEADTVTVQPYNSNSPSLLIWYGEELLSEKENWNFNGGRVSINLAEEIDASIFSENPDGLIEVEVYYDSLYQEKKVRVDQIFEQFVVVNAQVTALRNNPVVDTQNVLTDLAKGSQLKLVSREGDWFKVMYGISETWVSADDVNTIWRPSEFASELSVIAIPNVPFGSVDVERNIPVLGRSSLNSMAFILSNHEYASDRSQRIYGDRDAKLMQEYFIQGFGVRNSNLVKLENAESERAVNRSYTRLANSIAGGDQNLSVYINGFAKVIDDKVYLISSTLNESGEEQYIDLHKLFRAFDRLSLKSIIVFADLDIVDSQASEEVLENLASVLTNDNYDAAVLFSAGAGQRSGVFSSSDGPQNRHSIFTYYLAQAIKERKVTLSAIQEHLERNVPFTSRSLHERPQNPLLFGNSDLELLN